MLPLAAYADRLSVRPDETIRFHVANAIGEPVRAEVVRVRCADANPAGPGLCVEPVTTTLEQLSEPSPQTVPHGSYFIADALDGIDSRALTFTCLAFSTLEGKSSQTVAAAYAADGSPVFELVMDAAGRLAFRLGEHEICSTQPLALRRWYAVWCRLDGAEVQIATAPIDRAMGWSSPERTTSRSRTGSSGFKIVDSSKSAPSPRGVQASMP